MSICPVCWSALGRTSVTGRVGLTTAGDADVVLLIDALGESAVQHFSSENKTKII